MTQIGQNNVEWTLGTTGWEPGIEGAITIRVWGYLTGQVSQEHVKRLIYERLWKKIYGEVAHEVSILVREASSEANVPPKIKKRIEMLRLALTMPAYEEES